MSSWIQNSLSSKQTLLITALGTALATSSLILSYQALRRDHATERLKKQVGRDVEEWEASNAAKGFIGLSPEEIAERRAEAGAAGVKEWAKGEFDEGLIREQLSRNYAFLGEDGMEKVREGFVVVVGCGGVGSWAALMLLRSGVGKILLIDFDMVTLSSLNRHCCATLEDVGTPKVIATQKFLKKIAPWAQIEAHVGLWRKGEGDALLAGADWVVDAIDNIETKVDLITHCKNEKIKVFASMGASAKRDPTRVQMTDISETYEDPLARSVRRRLRMNGIHGGVPCVYSTEVPGEVKLLPLDEAEFQRGAVKELQAFDDFRVRILPVLGPLPAIFGLNISTAIILDLAGQPLTDALAIRHRKKVYASLRHNLSEREARVKGLSEQETIGLTVEDLGFIFEDLYGGKSSFPPYTIIPKPQAVKWDRNRPLIEDNVAIMSPGDAKLHESECLSGGRSVEEVWGKDKVEAVERRLDQARKMIAYRTA